MAQPDESPPFEAAELESRVDELATRTRRLSAAMSDLVRFSRGRQLEPFGPSPGFFVALDEFERDLRFVQIELERVRGAVPAQKKPAD